MWNRFWRWVAGPRPRHSREYTAYMRSPEWQVRRARVLRLAGYKCQDCGLDRSRSGGRGLQVHHLTYERLFHERDTDLVALCVKCHERQDRLRREMKAGRGRR